MNQLSDSVKYGQKSPTTKNKISKAKDPSTMTDEKGLINQDKLSVTLANTLNIKNFNNDIINGTSEHSKDTSDIQIKGLYNDLDIKLSNKFTKDVNNVQCSLSGEGVKSTTEICTDRLNSQDTTKKEQVHTLNLEDSGEKEIDIISYESELQMPEIMRLIQKDLSEPYSIYTYRYFIHNWPKLCFLATHDGKCIGAIVCKLDMHRNVVKRGYIAMLAVDEKYRKRKIGSKLVRKAIQAMINDNADEVVLETEITNKPALKLYENLGFVRDKRLFRYYLNGVDALRLKLWLR